jgi:hypothetical protein
MLACVAVEFFADLMAVSHCIVLWQAAGGAGDMARVWHRDEWLTQGDA